MGELHGFRDNAGKGADFYSNAVDAVSLRFVGFGEGHVHDLLHNAELVHGRWESGGWGIGPVDRGAAAFTGCVAGFAGTGPFSFKFFRRLGLSAENFDLVGAHGRSWCIELEEATFTASIDTIATENAFKVINLPCFIFFAADDGSGWAFFRAKIAEDTGINFKGDMTTGAWKRFPSLKRVEAGGGFTDGGTGDKVADAEEGHDWGSLTFVAGYAGVDGEDNDGHIRQVTALEHVHQGRYVGESGSANAESIEHFGPISFDEVANLSPGLFQSGHECAIGFVSDTTDIEIAVRDFFGNLLKERKALIDFVHANETAGVTIATLVSNGRPFELGKGGVSKGTGILGNTGTAEGGADGSEGACVLRIEDAKPFGAAAYGAIIAKRFDDSAAFGFN